MLKFKEGQTYICEKSFTTNWIEGKEYKTEYDEISDEYFIYDEFDYKFFDFDINKSKLVFKLKEENSMLKFKEGQTYICTEAYDTVWTVGQEYVVSLYDNNVPYLTDDNECKWIAEHLTKRCNKFRLKYSVSKALDLIENQPHYKNQGIEPIDLMRKNFSKEEFSGFLQGNVLKYMLRYKDKNGVEDLKKAKTYLTWLIEEEQNA